MDNDTLVEQISPEEQAARDSALVTDLEQKWAMADRYMADTFRLWKENIAFIEGMQWIRSRDNSMLNVQGANRNRIRLVDNRLLDHARRLHARLDQVSYAPTVVADSTDDGDKAAARMAQAALRWFDRKKKVRQERRKVNWWIVVCGQGYTEQFFDPQAGPLVDVPEIDPETKLPVQVPIQNEDGSFQMDEETQMPATQNKMVKEPAGDVDFLVRSPFAIRRDPRFQDWRKMRWIFVEETAAREEVVDRFRELVPDIEDKLPHDAYNTSPWMADLAGDTFDQTGLPKAKPPVKDVVTLKRYYERPSREYPSGRFVIYCTPIKLYEGPMPTESREFPIKSFSYMGRPWIFEGKSAVDAAKALQRLFNRILSRFAEHLVRLPAGWLLVPVTSGIPKRSFSNETGSIIRYVPGGGEPKFVFPPFGGLAWYDKFLARLEQSMEERMALPPAVRGQLPKGARAARTVELLQEAADSIQAPVLNDLADSWAGFYEQILEFMKERFTVERIVSIVGEDKRSETHEFRGDVLPRDWQDRLSVKVEAGESLPSSKMMRIEFILTLASKHGFFGKPGEPDYMKRLGEALDIDAGFMKTDSDIDVSIAEDENVKILREDPSVNVREYDDHLTHLRVHMMFMKRLVVSKQEEQANSVLPHLQQHQAAVAKLMAMQAKGSTDQAQPAQAGQSGGKPEEPGEAGGVAGRPNSGGASPSAREMNEPTETVMGS